MRSSPRPPIRDRGKPAASPTTGSQPVVSYNFRRPDRVTKDQMRSLHFLHDRFARNVSTSMSAYMRVVTEVSILSVEQFTYSEFLMSLSDPTAFYAVSMRPLEGIGALELKNPLIAASGCFGYGVEYAKALDLSTLGGVAVKGLFLKEREGHPPERIVETPSGMLNAIGLQGIGVHRFINEKLPELRQLRATVIVNICGSTLDEYAGIRATKKLLDAVLEEFSGAKK